jgi:zinc protease
MSSKILASLLLAALALPALAQQPVVATTRSTASMDAPLPLDPHVRSGTLANGLRYYVRQNARPEKRAELRLVVNAGSVLEREGQLGYAHFIEHMAFNGTTHFAKNELVSYLQTIGVQFGADLNANTGVDRTVYILPVPTDSATVLNRGFQILGDWARGQTFAGAEVVSERGVVREEWRGTKGAGDRVLRKILPVALRNSLYARRLPIGTEESIMAATPAGLRSFYDAWYRPDLMAVVAVGDFDPAAVERQIRTEFSRIPAARRARPRPSVGIPPNRAPLVAIASDPEITSTSIEVIYKSQEQPTRTAADFRRDLMGELYTGMLNARLAEIAQQPDAPFLGASASHGPFFARGASAFDLSASVKEGGAERGLEAVLTETRRVDQRGFLQSELDRAKQSLLRAYERGYAERERTNSGALVEEYIDNFLEGTAAPGIEAEYRLVQELVPAISLSEVNHAASGWITDENRIVVVVAPEKAGLALPTQQQLLAVFDRVATAPVTAYAENVSSEALVAALPTPGRVASERTVPGTDITEWTLSNGARVLVKATDFKADEVTFSAFASGGTSLASDADFMSAQLASQLVSIGGVGAFSRVDLAKKLSGKAVSLAPTIGETSEGLRGNASPKDLETLLQLAYLQITAPRRDTSAYQAFRNQATSMLLNRSADPNAVFGDSITVTMGQHGFRARPLTQATFNEVSLDRALAFYRDRFADASGFTFVFVGNVDRATLKPLVEQYLASLPSTGRKEAWKRVTSGPPPGVVDVTVRKGTENKATTLLAFTGPFTYTPENRVALRALGDYLTIKLTETLREQLGGSYSPGAGGQASRAPREEYLMQIYFASSPENVERLTPAVFAVIDSLKKNGPSAADVEKVKAQALRQRETELKQNEFWRSSIAARLQAGESLADIDAADTALLARITPAMIQEAARTYLRSDNHIRFVLLPEAKP